MSWSERQIRVSEALCRVLKAMQPDARVSIDPLHHSESPCFGNENQTEKNQESHPYWFINFSNGNGDKEQQDSLVAKFKKAGITADIVKFDNAEALRIDTTQPGFDANLSALMREHIIMIMAEAGRQLGIAAGKRDQGHRRPQTPFQLLAASIPTLPDGRALEEEFALNVLARHEDQVAALKRQLRRGMGTHTAAARASTDAGRGGSGRAG